MNLEKLQEQEYQLSNIFKENFRLPFNTLIPLFFNSFEIFSRQFIQAFQDNDKTIFYSYKYFQSKSISLSIKLMQLGLKLGDRVIFITKNHPDWLVSEVAALMTGAVTVPINPKIGPLTIRKIIDHCQPRIAFFQNEFEINKLIKQSYNFGKIKHNIVFSLKEKVPGNVLTIREMIQDISPIITVEGQKKIYTLKKDYKFSPIDLEKLKKRMNKITSNTIAGLTYTNFSKRENTNSYQPLAASISHGNIYANIMGLSKILPIKFQDSIISILSPSHTMEKVMSFLAIYRGAKIIHSQPNQIFKLMKQLKPTYLIAFPFLLEMLLDNINRHIKELSFFKKTIIKICAILNNQYLNSRRYFTKEETLFKRRGKKNVIFYLIKNLIILFCIGPLKPPIQIIFTVINKLFGGRLKYIVSMHRHLANNLDKSFDSFGFTILEGYGLPEAGPVIAIRRPFSRNHRPRRVLFTSGPLLEKTDIKLIDPRNGKDVSRNSGQEGQIYLRGPQIMKGYYRDEQATAKIIDKDNWLKTDDFGCLTTNNELQIKGKIPEPNGSQ